MDFRKINPQMIWLELIGAFTLALIALVFLWGPNPTLLPLVVALGYGIMLISANNYLPKLNPAISLALYSLRKININQLVASIIAQVAGSALAMEVMNLFLRGELVARVDAQDLYQTFFGEFLGGLMLGFGLGSLIHNRHEPLTQAIQLFGWVLIAMGVASLGSAGIVNPALALSLGSLNWSYLLGPLLGTMIGINLYSHLLGKKSKNKSKS